MFSITRQRKTRVAAGAIAGILGLGIGIQAPPLASPSHQRHFAKPVPFVIDHVSAVSFQNPPDTTYCRAKLGYACYQPKQIRHAYNLEPLAAEGFDGRGYTIVLIEAFGSPTIEADLRAFDKAMGLPDPPSFKVIAPVGPPPRFDPNNPDMVAWAEETSLDVEWAHAIAPGASLLVVTTPVSETEGITGFPEIVAAENYVIDHGLGDVISQSFGATEETFAGAAQIQGLRSAFANAREHGVAVLAASGDFGATNALPNTYCCYQSQVVAWPASDPLVTAVGATQLSLDGAGNRIRPDQVWHDMIGASGGGFSHVFGRPDYQDGLAPLVGLRRGIPDISMSGGLDGSVVVYYSFPNPLADPNPWHLVGGTSEATPLFAGVVAIADQIAGQRIGSVNQLLYQMGGAADQGVVDVTVGDNSFTFQKDPLCVPLPNRPCELFTVTGFKAGPGWDAASGWGTVDVNRFARHLAERRCDGTDSDAGSPSAPLPTPSVSSVNSVTLAPGQAGHSPRSSSAPAGGSIPGQAAGRPARGAYAPSIVTTACFAPSPTTYRSGTPIPAGPGPEGIGPPRSSGPGGPGAPYTTTPAAGPSPASTAGAFSKPAAGAPPQPAGRGSIAPGGWPSPPVMLGLL